MQPADSISTTLPPAWRRPVRLGWLLIAAASLTIFVVGNQILLTTPPPGCVNPATACPPGTISREDIQILEGLGIPFASGVLNLLAIVARVSLAVTGLIIFWRRSDDWVALLVSAGLLSVLVEGTPANMGQWELLITLITAAGTAIFYPIPFVFPNGRCEPPGLKPLVWIVAIGGGIAFGLSYNSPLWFGIGSGINGVWAVLAVYAMYYRYTRVSGSVEQQQIKWVLAGLAAAMVQSIVWFAGSTLFPVSQPSAARGGVLLVAMVVYVLAYGFFSYSFLVAMLRHRLWDVDILIRRTLQYSLLTALLALVYFGAVVLLQTLFGSFVGDQSPFVIVLSTLLIAALFTPLRRRVQTLIDRRFYRRKYDAQQVLTQFAQTARDEVEMETLKAELVRVVQETMQPETVAVWLKPTEH